MVKNGVGLLKMWTVYVDVLFHIDMYMIRTTDSILHL